MKINSSRTAKEEIPKNSAIPPQTPDIDRFFVDFRNVFFNSIFLFHSRYTFKHNNQKPIHTFTINIDYKQIVSNMPKIPKTK